MTSYSKFSICNRTTGFQLFRKNIVIPLPLGRYKTYTCQLLTILVVYSCHQPTCGWRPLKHTTYSWFHTVWPWISHESITSWRRDDNEVFTPRHHSRLITTRPVRSVSVCWLIDLLLTHDNSIAEPPRFVQCLLIAFLCLLFLM